MSLGLADAFFFGGGMVAYRGLRQVISGAQTGADIAGLRAAKKRGIPTGGSMPKGFRTTSGPKPEWAEEFGLTEHPSDDYRHRTIDNILSSTGTVILSYDYNSPGTVLTGEKAKSFGRPLFKAYLIQDDDVGDTKKLSYDIATWILKSKIEVLNVAGNSDRFPDIEERVFEILCEAFRMVGCKEQS